MSPAPYCFANLRFDPTDGRLEPMDGASSGQLRPQVARLLLAFLAKPQTLLERDELCASVWDEGTVVDFEAGLAAILRELRAELKNLGAPTDLIETVPRRGYRLNSPVRRELKSTGFSRAGRKRLLGLGLALLLLILAGLHALLPSPAPPPQVMDRSLAVLPFSQFGEAAADPRRLDLLIADQMLVQLWERELDRVILIGRASITPYAGRPDLAQAIAEDLSVDLLIEGSVVFDGGQVSVSGRMLEMPGGRIVWSHQIDHDEDELPPIAELARALVESLAESWQGDGQDDGVRLGD